MPQFKCVQLDTAEYMQQCFRWCTDKQPQERPETQTTVIYGNCSEAEGQWQKHNAVQYATQVLPAAAER